ncbi:MAG: efflux RND transporter permease subunit [Candidatus Omnitrophota bacterium]|nr:MAG: efflux RND transporter permease subunit [Candidatus Omnitrophota bacterium]
MNLPNLSIRRPIAISMVFLIFLLWGVLALFRLPVELRPNVEIGNITVELRIRGGISPQEVEDTIARPLEDSLSVIGGLEDIITISEEGECRIILYFKPEVNLDYAVVEVRERFAQVQHKLPKEVERPVIAKYEYAQVPVVILGVTSRLKTVEQLRRIAEEKMKNRFSRIEGVAKIEIGGGREEKIFVEVNEIALRSRGLTIDDVTKTLNENNLNLIAGNVDKAGGATYLVRTVGQFRSLEDIKNLPINPSGDAHMVRIADIAKIGVSYLDPHALARVNSQPSISLYIQKSSGANTVKVVREVVETIGRLRQELAADIDIQPYFNHADYIKQAIATVRNALYIGAFLSVLVLWAFLRNIKYTLIISLTIPFSVITAFSLMYLSKISINVVTLSGIALGIGILVDSSIVVLENIFKKREQAPIRNDNIDSETLKLTAEQGASEVFIAIIASTLTTVAVFVPLFFVNREIQRLYSGLALTVVFALLTSLFFSFTLVPLLASRISTKRNSPNNKLTPEQEPIADSGSTSFDEKRSFKKSVFDDLWGGIKKLKISEVGDVYKKCINFVLKKKYFFIGGTVILLILAFVQIADLGREFIGIAEQNRFTVYVQMPSGTKIEVSDEVVKKVEEILDNIPEIKNHTSRVKGWSSQIYVELENNPASGRGVDEIIEEIRRKTEGMEPAFIYGQQPESVGRKEIMVEVFGSDYDLLKNLANQVGGKIKGAGTFKDVKLRMRSGRPEIHVIFDRNRLALHGLTVLDVSNILHAKMRGLIATRFHTTSSGNIMLTTNVSGSRKMPTIAEYGHKAFHGELKKLSLAMGGFADSDLGAGASREVETIARLEKSFRDTLEDMYNLSLRGRDKSLIYLQQVADIKAGLGPAEIWRKNKERMVQVSADTGKLALSESAQIVNNAVSDIKFPKEYHYKFGGDYDKMIRNQRELTQAIVLALFLVYIVLASVFESFSQPFIVLASVPMAVIGVSFGLKLANEPIGLGVYVGAVVLIGIVVNNAIILIDYINRLRGVGAYKKLTTVRLAIVDAVRTASLWRLRPILMTSLTTILTMVPLIFQRGGTSSLWRPLAITIVSGMATSTLLTLFIIPSIYLVAEDITKLVSFKWFFSKSS